MRQCCHFFGPRLSDGGGGYLPPDAALAAVALQVGRTRGGHPAGNLEWTKQRITIPTNIATVHLVTACPNARAGVKIEIKKKEKKGTLEQPNASKF